MSGLRLAGIVHRYGTTTAIDGLNLEVREGELITLLGPSGCGKTTTLRIVAGFLAPEGGEVWFDERPMNGVPPHRRNTAMVFQSYALFPHMTVAENVTFGLRMRKVAAAEQRSRLAEVLSLVSLTGLEERRPGQLSGGQQQRVALARAIITRPDILLFDEPLSNLDAKLRERVRIEIRALQRRLGITSLYVTHDQAEALAISDRIVVMNNGRIEQIGEPGAIYREPATSFVADFLGLANIIEGESLGDGEAQTAVGRLRVATALPPAGHPVRLSWRPEDMKLPADGLANRLRGRIATLVFRGSCIEVELVIAGHSIRAQVDNALHLREGETIDLGLAPDRIRMVS